MDNPKDPLLEKIISSEKYSQTSLNPFEEGLYIVGLTNEQIDIFGSFINEIYFKIEKIHGRQNRQITRNGLTMLRGAIFAIGTRKMNNIEWKEHCASSLREIFHEWKNSDFRSEFILIYKNTGENLSDDESGLFELFKLHYNYFSGIDHHNASKIMWSLRQMFQDESLKLPDCYNDEVFIGRVKSFFNVLKAIMGIARVI